MELNFLQKINAVKLALVKAKLKMTGENKHSNFAYAELSDFMPKIIELENEYGLYSKIDFGREKPTLIVKDIMKPQDYEEYCLDKELATVAKASAIQNVGATSTYYRKFLYGGFYGISFPEFIDNQEQAPEPKIKSQDVSEWTDTELLDFSVKTTKGGTLARTNGGDTVRDLTVEDITFLLNEVHYARYDKLKLVVKEAIKRALIGENAKVQDTLPF